MVTNSSFFGPIYQQIYSIKKFKNLTIPSTQTTNNAQKKSHQSYSNQWLERAKYNHPKYQTDTWVITIATLRGYADYKYILIHNFMSRLSIDSDSLILFNFLTRNSHNAQGFSNSLIQYFSFSRIPRFFQGGQNGKN